MSARHHRRATSTRAGSSGENSARPRLPAHNQDRYSRRLMTTPQLLTDIANLMLLLAPSASLLCLALAGVSLRRETGGISFVIGSGFMKWMFWAVVFLTLPSLLSLFGAFGVNVPALGGSISSPWLAGFESDISSFVQNFVIARMVVRALLDTAEGGHPLPSILGALFLLGVETTYTLMTQINTGTQYSMTDVLGSLWTYLASVIMPIAAGLAVFGAIINFATGKPAMRLVALALAFMCVSGLWYLVRAMAM